MEWRVRQQFEDQWRTAEFVPHKEHIFSGEESIQGFSRSREGELNYAYDPYELSARDRGHSASTTALRSSDVLNQFPLPVRSRDYETRVIRPSPLQSLRAGQGQSHVSAGPRAYETRDAHSSSREDRNSSAGRTPSIQSADQKSTRRHYRNFDTRTESNGLRNAYDQPIQTGLQPDPQNVPPPGYSTALAESREDIQAFLNDEYDPPPPYASPGRSRRRDKKKEIRAKDHQKSLSWLAGRRRLGGE